MEGFCFWQHTCCSNIGVKIFDTTLRDGEQSPGASLTVDEKIAIAHQLAALNVDIIEAGFPISSPEDFEAVRRVALEVEGPTVCGLARTVPEDIDRCWEAVKESPHPRIHTFVGTSKIHIEKKLHKSAAEVLEMAVAMVRHACELCSDVEFSPEDAMRTDLSYLTEIVQATIEAGATTINIPDTVGYTTPWEMQETITYLFEHVANIDQCTISVHCHDDLGMSVANSLAAVKAGAGQVECTINGMGERAGNASLEEIVMALRTRGAEFNATTNVRTQQVVQHNKAIVGENAFAHEAGIHQHGVIMDRQTYEIMRPEDVGLSESVLTLGRRSGRHGLRQRLEELGYKVGDDQIDGIYERFLVIADKKKQVYDEDLQMIMHEATAEVPEVWELVSLETRCSNRQRSGRRCLPGH